MADLHQSKGFRLVSENGDDFQNDWIIGFYKFNQSLYLLLIFIYKRQKILMINECGMVQIQVLYEANHFIDICLPGQFTLQKLRNQITFKGKITSHFQFVFQNKPVHKIFERYIPVSLIEGGAISIQLLNSKDIHTELHPIVETIPFKIDSQSRQSGSGSDSGKSIQQLLHLVVNEESQASLQEQHSLQHKPDFLDQSVQNLSYKAYKALKSDKTSIEDLLEQVQKETKIQTQTLDQLLKKQEFNQCLISQIVLKINQRNQSLELIKDLESQIIQKQLYSQFAQNLQDLFQTVYSQIDLLLSTKKSLQEEIKKKQLKGKQQILQSLNLYQYLLQIFTVQEQIIKKCQITDRLLDLNLNGTRIQMGKFVQQDWILLEKLSLDETDIDCQKWNIIVQNANKFQNLKQLSLSGNKITRISIEDLRCFRQLRILTINDNKLDRNTLKMLERLHSLEILKVECLRNPQNEIEESESIEDLGNMPDEQSNKEAPQISEPKACHQDEYDCYELHLQQFQIEQPKDELLQMY